jgi:hypothetical protein
MPKGESLVSVIAVFYLYLLINSSIFIIYKIFAMLLLKRHYKTESFKYYSCIVYKG